MIISCGLVLEPRLSSSFWQPLLKAGEMTDKKGWPGGFSVTRAFFEIIDFFGKNVGKN